ncbi:alpha/beta fold hydrolase [Pseudomonas sp. GWSMS-1]|uniref:alpha/beta fold hydrolase n=1 Tax=Pseudomonas sp. GWSMS-1 TaxID=3308997 RepID=UPI003CEF6FA6
MTQSVFFAHANGFPSATYGKLFCALAPDYQVQHLDQHGHDPRFPVNDNWSNLVDELIHHLEANQQPVWGVGHSLGGVLHYHAALLRPELYLGVVMLDSPVLTLADKIVIRAAKRFGFIDRITPPGAPWAGVRSLSTWPKHAAISPPRACFAASTPSVWRLMFSMACRRARITCACALIPPRKSAFIAACRTPALGARSNCKCRWLWCGVGTVGWSCRTTRIWCGVCRKVST